MTSIHGFDTAFDQLIGPLHDQQDRVELAAMNRGLIVTDGVGSRAGSGEAARLVADECRVAIDAAIFGNQPVTPKFLMGVVRSAWQRLVDVAASEGVSLMAGSDLGPASATTLGFALILDDLLWVCRVGDVRITVVRDGVSVLVTDDQNLLTAVLREQPLNPPTDSKYLASVITGLIAVDQTLPVISVEAIGHSPGDIVLVTTDGVHDCIGHQGLVSAAAHFASGATEVAKQAMRQVEQLGITDNATVAVMVTSAYQSS